MQDDELIIRFADGELEPAEWERAEARAAADPDFRAAVERQRALRRTVAAAFDPILDEPVPERLTAAAQGAAVVDLASRRRAASPAPRFGPAHWGAMAATLAVGVFAGHLVQQDRDALIGRSGEQLVARGDLAEALTVRTAASEGAAGPVRVGLSFRASDGVYCRTFEGAERMAGVACREDGAWAIRMAVRHEAPRQAYRMAASAAPPAVLAFIETTIDGEPLDAGEEAAAKARGWTAR